MCFPPLDPDLVRPAALVADHRAHVGRLTDDAKGSSAWFGAKAMWIGRLRSAATHSGTLASTAARNPFMSQEPRANSLPSRSSSLKGSDDHSWPSTGTASVWPDRIMPPDMSGPMLAQRLALV